VNVVESEKLYEDFEKLKINTKDTSK